MTELKGEVNKPAILVGSFNLFVSLTEKLEGLNDTTSHLYLIYIYKTLCPINAKCSPQVEHSPR